MKRSGTYIFTKNVNMFVKNVKGNQFMNLNRHRCFKYKRVEYANILYKNKFLKYAIENHFWASQYRLFWINLCNICFGCAVVRILWKLIIFLWYFKFKIIFWNTLISFSTGHHILSFSCLFCKEKHSKYLWGKCRHQKQYFKQNWDSFGV